MSGIMTLTVVTTFGCVCGACQCETCGKGRKYEVTVHKSDLVQAILDKMIEQNPLIAEKKVVPTFFSGHEILNLETRLPAYDLEDGSKIFAAMAPTLCCTADFRRAPPQQKKKEQKTPAPPAPQENEQEEEEEEGEEEDGELRGEEAV